MGGKGEKVQGLDEAAELAGYDSVEDARPHVVAVPGGDWPERARTTALALSGAARDEDEPAGIQLLADLRGLFDERGSERLSSAEIVAHLATLDERPWPEWYRGNPITKGGVSRLLKPFGIHPRQLWIAGAKTRGYEVAMFRDAWNRYELADRVRPTPLDTNGRSGSSLTLEGLTAIQHPVGDMTPTVRESDEMPRQDCILPLLPNVRGEPGVGPHAGASYECRGRDPRIRPTAPEIPYLTVPHGAVLTPHTLWS